MAGKLFGDMTHAEKMAAMKRAADLLAAELTANAPAIAAVMDSVEIELNMTEAKEKMAGVTEKLRDLEYADQERDFAEESYLGNFCPACGTAGCTWNGKPDGFHTDD